MAETNTRFVEGSFTGYFYTLQKNVMSMSETPPAGSEHMVHIYRGTLSDAKSMPAWNPSGIPEPDTLVFKGLDNIQFSSTSEIGLTRLSGATFSYAQLNDIKVDQRFERDGKSYARIQGTLRGILLDRLESDVSPAPDPIISNPPHDQTPEPSPPPVLKDPHDQTFNQPDPVQYVPDRPSGGNTNPIPSPPPIAPVPRGVERKGCLSIPDSFFRILKYLLLFLLIIWLFRQCNGCFNKIDCEELKGKLRKSQQLDSLRADTLARVRFENWRNSQVLDSLRRSLISRDSLRRFTKQEESLREELKAISEKIYFYGGKDEIREESFSTIEQLVILLRENPSMRIEIRGFYNGNSNQGIDRSISLRRAIKVKDLLIEGGIDPERLVPADYGNSNPVDDFDELKEEKGMKYNRNMRVEFEIIRD